jgi:hypothetical protein
MKKDSIETIKYKFLMPGNMPISKASNTSINYDFGIPKAKEITTENNGVPFSISDINQLANIGISNNILFNCGLYYRFDSEYCKLIGGYPRNSILVQIKDNTYKYVLSLLDDNYFDFETEGVDDIHWKYIQPENYHYYKKFRYEKLFESTIQQSAVTGDNNGKWVKITNLNSQFVYRLIPYMSMNENNAQGIVSVATFICVSDSINNLDLSPDDIIKNNYDNVYYVIMPWTSNYLYVQKYKDYSTTYNYSQRVWTTVDSTNFSANTNNIYISPYMYCSVWIRNVNRVNSDINMTIYGEQL